MKIRKIIQRHIRHERDGVHVVGDVNAAVSANVNEPGGSSTHVSSKQTVVQRGGKTVASEGATDEEGGYKE